MSLTPSEQRLIDCVGHGRVADFSAAAESKPTQGYAWGPERTIRCEVIKALVTGASECRVGAVGISYGSPLLPGSHVPADFTSDAASHGNSSSTVYS